MKLWKQLVAWFMINRKYVTFWFVIAVIALALIGWIGKAQQQKHNLKLAVELAQMHAENKSNEQLITVIKKGIEIRDGKIKVLEQEKEDIRKDRDKTKKERDQALRERDDAIAGLENLSDDDLFQLFLKYYPQSGTKEYIINENQVSEVVRITVDYEYVVEDNKSLEKDVNDCERMVIKGDSINDQLKLTIDDYVQTDSLNNKIIDNLKQENNLISRENKKIKLRDKIKTGVLSAIIVIETVIFLTAGS